MSHWGIDISSNDARPIDYQAVVADLEARGGGDKCFCFIKATEATGYANPFFNADAAGFRAAGAAVGAYIFDHGTAIVGAEETYFRSIAGPNMPQADDMEDPQGVYYPAHTAGLLGQDPAAIVYSAGADALALNGSYGYGLWLADPNGLPGSPSMPCLIQQFSWTGAPAGMSGDVDWNIWLGSEASFSDYFALAPPAAPPAPTPGGTMIAHDPISGGLWVTDPDGAVYAYDGAPYLGGLNNADHASWKAGTAQGGPPCVGIAYATWGTTDGYALVCWAPGAGAPTIYRMPRDGRYAA